MKVNLTEQDFMDAFKVAEQIKDHPMIPVSPLSRPMFEAACSKFGIDKDAAIADGKRYNVDAVLMGFGIIFTQPIPQTGVVWKGKPPQPKPAPANVKVWGPAL